MVKRRDTLDGIELSETLHVSSNEVNHFQNEVFFIQKINFNVQRSFKKNQ